MGVQVIAEDPLVPTPQAGRRAAAAPLTAPVVTDNGRSGRSMALWTCTEPTDGGHFRSVCIRPGRLDNAHAVVRQVGQSAQESADDGGGGANVGGLPGEELAVIEGLGDPDDGVGEGRGVDVVGFADLGLDEPADGLD
jgi:hypothetical protein